MRFSKDEVDNHERSLPDGLKSIKQNEKKEDIKDEKTFIYVTINRYKHGFRY